MRRMVCDSCWSLWEEKREQKTMGGFGPCCVCGDHVPLGGPIGMQEQAWLLAKFNGLDPGTKPE